MRYRDAEGNWQETFPIDQSRDRVNVVYLPTDLPDERALRETMINRARCCFLGGPEDEVTGESVAELERAVWEALTIDVSRIASPFDMPMMTSGELR